MGTYTSNSTVFASSISTFLRSLSSQLATVETRIATTKRVNSARDDAVAFFQSEKLTIDASALRGVVKDDLEHTIGVFETASSTIAAIRDKYTTLQDLAADAASGSPSQPRWYLDSLFEIVKTEISNLISGSFYDGVAVVGGAYDSSMGGQDLSVMYTADVNQRATLRVDGLSLARLGLQALDISTQANAQSASNSLTDDNSISTALSLLNYYDSHISQRLETVESYNDYAAVQATNYEAAATSMTEADTVWEVARQTALQIQQQAAISVLAQGNVRATYVLNLFPNLTSWA